MYQIINKITEQWNTCEPNTGQKQITLWISKLSGFYKRQKSMKNIKCKSISNIIYSILKLSPTLTIQSLNESCPRLSCVIFVAAVLITNIEVFAVLTWCWKANSFLNINKTEICQVNSIKTEYKYEWRASEIVMSDT